ncbi:PRC-barrel domain-containing protein [Patescibacteria group bacterium]|nr:PRC-barrel domain-containing protein [Patescibacteria group bacterium]
MQILIRRIINLPVRTRSGQVLGRVVDSIIDTETGRIAFLLVRSRGLIQGLMGDALKIAWSQIISIDDKDVVVTDLVVREEAASLALSTPSTAVNQKTFAE